MDPLWLTGLGVVCPLGHDPDALWSALDAGRSGVGLWSQPPPRVASHIGGEVRGFEPLAALAGLGLGAEVQRLAADLLRDNPRATGQVVVAAAQAIASAQLQEAYPSERIGHVLACHNTHGGYWTQGVLDCEDEPDFIEPMFGVHAFDTDAAAVIAELFGIRGPTFTVGGACASGNMALLAAEDLIRTGRADAVVVGGVATTPSPVVLQGWAIIQAIVSERFLEAPHRASRPFDLGRCGFVPAEGAGAVVLERASRTSARRARAQAELLATAATSAAVRHTRPAVEAQIRCARAALQRAGLSPAAVGYVNAHGTSTPVGDAVEVASIREVLGARAEKVPVSSTKSMLGHALQAASLIELVATVQSLQHQRVHPTINLDDPDPELGLDFVPGHSRSHTFDVALSNALGFGGLNACAVVGLPR